MAWIADEAHMDHELRQKMVWGRSLLDPNLFDPKLTKLQSFRELVDSDDGHLDDKNPGVNVDVNSKSTVGDKHLESS